MVVVCLQAAAQIMVKDLCSNLAEHNITGPATFDHPAGCHSG
jgi:hypothetical protein